MTALQIASSHGEFTGNIIGLRMASSIQNAVKQAHSEVILSVFIRNGNRRTSYS